MIMLIGCRGRSRRLLPALRLHLPSHPKCQDVCSSIHLAPQLRTGNWLEKAKRQRTGESMSPELVTDTHCHHLCSAKQLFENKLQEKGTMSSAGSPAAPGQ